jgi:PAS domain S-box-containing protein
MNQQHESGLKDIAKTIFAKKSKVKQLEKKLDWLSGGGEMADIIRARDWSKTSLGPLEAWPASLRTTVSLCLASNFPINIIWGPEAIQLYNSGYKVLCGEAHPRAIGESYYVTWKSAWPAIGESFEKARRGEASFLKNQRMFLQRNGYLEETFFTFSISPIRDESGKVVGLFNPVTEMTEASLGQRRSLAIRELTSKGLNCSSVLEAWKLVVKTLETFQNDLPAVVIFEKKENQEFVFVGQTGNSTDFSDVSKWPLKEAQSRYGPYLVDDVIPRFGKVSCTEYPEPIERAYMVPIRAGVNQETIGFIIVALSTRLAFDERYKNFIHVLCGSIGSMVSSARVKSDTEKERRRLYEVFMQGPIPTVILLGSEHRYSAANQPYEKLVGRKVIGKTVLEAFTHDEIKTFLPLLDNVYKTGEPYTGKALSLSIPDENGIVQERFLNVGYHPFRDHTEEIKGVLAVHVDVTDEVNALKQLEQSESRFKSLANSMPVMVWAARLNGEIFYYNQRWFDYTGQSLHEAMDTGWADVIHPDDLARTNQGWKKCIETETPFYHECRFKRSHDQEYRWHLTRAEPIRNSDGKIWTWFGTSTDIHAQKIFMNELDIAKATAEMATLSKSSFLANMSHEIRTPLSAILGFTEILKSEDIGLEERKKYLNIIDRNGQGLVRIIDDILDLSKIEAGKVEIEKSSLCLTELLHDVIGMFADRAYGKGISLFLNTQNLPDFNIDSDSARIRQILINLIGNAIKFTTQGSICVSGKYKELKEGGIKLTLLVTDTGIGIPPEQAKTIFKAFTQADNSTSRRYGGTGLGLALSKRLAKAMGGNISIENNEAVGKGSIFKITIQVERSKTVSEVEEHGLKTVLKPAGKRLESWKLLVIDDSPDNLMLLKIILEREGALVETAAGGELGVEMALANTYDAVLTDIQMPVVDGYETLARLRSRHYKKPIFALTAHAMKEERNRIIAKGFSGHIAKPVDPSQLVETLVQSANIF